MNSRTRLLILVAAAVALWFARDAFVPAGVSEATASRGGNRPARPVAAAARPFDPSTAEVCTVPAAMPARDKLAGAMANDPFTLWQPPAPKTPVAVVAVVVPPPQPPAPPPPPPLPALPYRYLGALDEKGAPSAVFLGLGTTLITAKAGDTLEGGFRLDSISPRELTFMHLQQKQTVRLRVEGETQ
jgi:hypothetical protein